MSENDVDDNVPTTVKHDLVTLDRVFDATNKNRDALALKLQETINNLSLSGDDPKLLAAQLGIMKTYLQILDSTDANVRSRVASKLKQVESETGSKHSAAVADFLTKIKTTGNNFNLGGQAPTPEEIDHQMEEAFQTSGLDPILTTELKMDPKDLQD